MARKRKILTHLGKIKLQLAYYHLVALLSNFKVSAIETKKNSKDIYLVGYYNHHVGNILHMKTKCCVEDDTLQHKTYLHLKKDKKYLRVIGKIVFYKSGH